MTYNMDGNPVLSKGYRGKTDALENVQNHENHISDAAEPEIRSLYTYDEQGFLIQAGEGGCVYRYERDTEGNTLSKSSSGKILYTSSYDTCGRLKTLDGIRYHYDKAGRLKHVKAAGGMQAASNCRGSLWEFILL